MHIHAHLVSRVGESGEETRRRYGHRDAQNHTSTSGGGARHPGPRSAWSLRPAQQDFGRSAHQEMQQSTRCNATEPLPTSTQQENLRNYLNIFSSPLCSEVIIVIYVLNYQFLKKVYNTCSIVFPQIRVSIF